MDFFQTLHTPHRCILSVVNGFLFLMQRKPTSIFWYEMKNPKYVGGLVVIHIKSLKIHSCLSHLNPSDYSHKEQLHSHIIKYIRGRQSF